MQNSFSSHSQMQDYLHLLLNFSGNNHDSMQDLNLTDDDSKIYINGNYCVIRTFLLSFQVESISPWYSFSVLTAIQEYVATLLNHIPKAQPVSRLTPCSGLSYLVPEMDSKRFQLQSSWNSLALPSSLKSDSHAASYNHFSHVKTSKGGGVIIIMIWELFFMAPS